MGRVLSPYLHASIFTLLSLSGTLLLSYLFLSSIQSAALIRRLMKPLSTPQSGSIQTAARARPGDQIALWFYADESKSRAPSKLFQCSATLDCLAIFFFFRGDPLTIKRAHFTSIQFETDREKEGCAEWKASASLFFFFWWKISSCQEAFRSSKEKKEEEETFYTYTKYLHVRPRAVARTLLCKLVHARSHNQIVAHPHRKTSIRAVAVFFFFFFFFSFFSASVAVDLQFKVLWVFASAKLQAPFASLINGS